jgi:hypothetical protein
MGLIMKLRFWSSNEMEMALREDILPLFPRKDNVREMKRFTQQFPLPHKIARKGA